jgi:hypothetical protein
MRTFLRSFLRWILIGREPAGREQFEGTDAELETARLLMLAAARSDLPRQCVRAVGQALVQSERHTA